MMPLCRAERVGVIPWSPLARGLLADRPADTVRAQTDEYARKLYSASAAADQKIIERVRTIASKHGVPAAQIALAWLYHKPWITAPILGVSKPHHLTDALAALKIKLSSEEIKSLEEPYVPHAVVGHE